MAILSKSGTTKKLIGIQEKVKHCYKITFLMRGCGLLKHPDYLFSNFSHGVTENKQLSLGFCGINDKLTNCPGGRFFLGGWRELYSVGGATVFHRFVSKSGKLKNATNTPGTFAAHGGGRVR